MINLADIIVIAIIGFSAFFGYKSGFIKTGLGFLAVFIAIALTFIFYKPVMGLIKDNTEFEPWLTSYLSSLDSKQFVPGATSEENNKADGNKNSYINNLPDSLVELIGLNEMKENAKNAIIQKVVEFALKLLAIVVVYVAARVGLTIIIIVLDSIAQLPVLKQFNEILGLVVGAMLGLLKVFGFFTIIAFLGSVSATSGIVSLINNSTVASYLYNNNIILKLLF